MQPTEVDIWLDDERDPVDHGFYEGALVFKTAEALKTWLEACEDWGHVTMSLDHDLGSGRMTGYDLMVWMEEQVLVNGRNPPFRIYIHSQNPVGREQMRACRYSIYNGRTV